MKNGTIGTRLVCAVLFCSFSFAWLFFHQADVLSLAQYILSGAQTHYNRAVGAVLITVLLYLLQLGVQRVLPVLYFTHALTFFPSMLALTLLSSVSFNKAFGLQQPALGWWLLLLLVAALWACVCWVSSQMLPSKSEKASRGLFSRSAWVNALTMVVMMLGLVAFNNNNAVLRYRAHAEVALLEGDDKEALRVGAESLETDAHLTMLRAFALARQGELGEHLFDYPIHSKGADLLPLFDSQSRFLALPADSVLDMLSVLKPKREMSVYGYFRVLDDYHVGTATAADYYLCALLIDRRLDDFARVLKRHYPIDNRLPRHYKEALLLYAHQREHPVVIYKDAVMEEDWNDMQQLMAERSKRSERNLFMLENYRGSYWYYYFYE